MNTLNSKHVDAEFIETAIEAAEIGIWDTDLSNNIMFLSHKSYQLFNITPGSPLTKNSIICALHPDDRCRAEEKIAEALDPVKRSLYDIEYRIGDESGNVLRWVHSIGRAYFDEAGKAIRFTGSSSDVSDRKKIEKQLADTNENLQYLLQKRNELEQQLEQKIDRRTLELEQQKTLLSTVLDSSFDGVYVMQALRNEEGEIKDFLYLYVNQLTAEMLGLSAEEIRGKTLLTLLPQSIENGFYDLFCNTIANGTPHKSETHFVSDRFTAWFQYSIVPVDTDKLVVTVGNITEQKQVLEDLKRTNANLEEFAFAASHDMKEPVRKIQVFSEKLRDRIYNKLDEKDRWHLERMQNAANRISTMIDDLLTYTLMSKGIQQFEPVNLNDVARLCLYDLELTLKEKDAVIEVDELPIVQGQNIQMQQLFQNLLSNALKFTKSDTKPVIKISSKIMKGREVGIALTTLEMDQYFNVVSFSDNGIGFEQQYADKIFTMFTRLHGNSDYWGTGIGLSIVQKIIENHNGYIKAEATPGAGATFTILLPIR